MTNLAVYAALYCLKQTSENKFCMLLCTSRKIKKFELSCVNYFQMFYRITIVAVLYGCCIEARSNSAIFMTGVNVAFYPLPNNSMFSTFLVMHP